MLRVLLQRKACPTLHCIGVHSFSRLILRLPNHTNVPNGLVRGWQSPNDAWTDCSSRVLMGGMENVERSLQKRQWKGPKKEVASIQVDSWQKYFMARRDCYCGYLAVVYDWLYESLLHFASTYPKPEINLLHFRWTKEFSCEQMDSLIMQMYFVSGRSVKLSTRLYPCIIQSSATRRNEQILIPNSFGNAIPPVELMIRYSYRRKEWRINLCLGYHFSRLHITVTVLLVARKTGKSSHSYEVSTFCTPVAWSCRESRLLRQKCNTSTKGTCWSEQAPIGFQYCFEIQRFPHITAIEEICFVLAVDSFIHYRWLRQRRKQCAFAQDINAWSTARKGWQNAEDSRQNMSNASINSKNLASILPIRSTPSIIAWFDFFALSILC